MIFKTLNGDLTVFNKTLISTKDHLKSLQTVNATVYNKNGAFNLQGLLINSSQSVSTFTKLNNAFKAYNGNLSKSTQLQNAYVQAVGKQNVTLGNYLAGLNGAKASVGGHVKSLVAAKAASIGLQAASIALNTAISMGITLAISALISQISKWVHAQEKARQKAIELTNSYKEQKDSLDSQIEKYKALKETLDNGNLSTDETRSIKEQLLEIQKSLIESYGDEASNIDLVNGKYREQLGLLSELSKEKADEYVKENRSAYEDAKRELEKIHRYEIGPIFSYDGRDGISDAQKQLYDYIKSYSELFEIRSMYDTSTFNNSDYAPTLFVNANADEAKLLIDQFYDDIEKYIKENNLELDYDSIQIDLSKVSSNIETDDSLKEYREIYDEFMKAEIVRNDTLRPLYQQSIQAVEDYNNALSSGKGIDEAKANLDAVQQSVQNSTGELEGSQEVFDDIYDSINKSAESAYSLGQAFENDESVKGYAEKLKGLTDIDLQAINFEDNVQSPGEEAFKALIEILGLSKDEVQSLIDKLVELGYVQGDIQSSTSNIENPISLSISDTIDQLNTRLKPAFDAMKSAYQGIFTDGGGFSPGNVDFSALGAIRSALDEMSDPEGLNLDVDYSAFENLARALADSSSEPYEVQEAFDSLAASVLNAANITGGMDESAVQLTASFLESMGIANAQEAAMQALSEAKANAFLASYDLANATRDETNAMLAEAGAAGISAGMIFKLAAEERVFGNQGLSTEGKVQELKKLAGEYGKTAIAARIARMEKAAGEGHVPVDYGKELAALQDEINSSLNSFHVNFDGMEKSAGSAKNAASEAKDAADELGSGLDSLQSAYGTLKDATDEYNRDGHISMETARKLCEVDFRYAAMLDGENGRLSVNAQKFREVTAAKLGEMKTSLARKALDVIKSLATEAEATEYLASANRDLAGSLGGVTEAELEAAYQSALAKGGRIAEAAEAAMAGYRNMASMLGNADPGSIMGGDTQEEARTAAEKAASAIERTLEKLERAFTRIKRAIDNTFISWAKRNGNFDAAIAMTKKQIDANMAAHEKYSALAASAADEDDAHSYAQKAEECADAVEDLKIQLGELARLRFDHIRTEFEGLLETTDKSIESLDIRLGDQSRVKRIGDYTSKIMETRNIIHYLEQEYKKLGAALDDAVASGYIEQGSEAWREMYNQVLGVRNAIQENEAAVRRLIKEEFDFISEPYDNAMKLMEHERAVIDSQMKKLEASGYVASEGMYRRLMETSGKELESLQKQKRSMEESLDAAVKDGTIEKYSGYWHEMKEAINSVASSIMDLNTRMLEFRKNIMELRWEKFDRLQEDISQMAGEADFMGSLLGTDSLHGEKGEYTDKGLASLGLHAASYNIYMAQADAYADKIKEIDKELAEDPYNTELIRRKRELISAQRDMIKSAEDEKKAMTDLASTGYQKMADALKELIDKKKEALSAEKSLYEYQKSVAEKTRDIAMLQKRIAALSGDSSEERKAETQKLKAELEEAEKDLKDTEYDKWVNGQQEMLDSLYEEYRKLLEEKSADTDALLSELIKTTNDNADKIGETLADAASKVGYDLTEELRSIWDTSAGETGAAVEEYTKEFRTKTTSILDILEGLYKINEAMYKASSNLADAGIAADGLDTRISNEDTASGFVEQMYRNFLGRDADGAGLKYWVRKLMNGATVADVVEGFLGSDEYKAMGKDPEQAIADLYKGIYGGNGADQGYYRWVAQLDSGVGLEAVINDFLSSDEYTAGNHSQEETVKRLFEAILGREADKEGLKKFMDALGDGASMGYVIQSMLRSNEFIGNGFTSGELVKNLYKGLLRRGVEDADGFLSYMKDFDSGNPEESMRKIVQRMLTSEKFLAMLAKGMPAGAGTGGQPATEGAPLARADAAPGGIGAMDLSQALDPEAAMARLGHPAPLTAPPAAYAPGGRRLPENAGGFPVGITQNNDIQIICPEVKDAGSLIREVQTNTRLQKALQAVTVDPLAGRGGLARFSL